MKKYILSSLLSLGIIFLTGCAIQNQQMAPTSITQQTSQPTTCTDAPEGEPVITSLSVYEGPVGTKLEIKGCNFSGFEGDITAWIENNQGVAGILYGENGSTSKLIRIILKSPLCQKDTSYSGLPCDAQLTLIPGTYKVYVTPWGKTSNKLEFTIKPPPQTAGKCGIENCHGMDITCGPNVADVCTEIYMAGDNCRQFAKCQVINGQCQLAESAKFASCKSCVQKCEADTKNNQIDFFQCEGKCAN